MSDTEANNTPAPEAEKLSANNKRTLYIILLITVAPIALAYFSFFTGIGVPQSTVSYGEIINPAVNINALFENENQGYGDDFAKDKKWRLFIPVGENCDQECQQILFVTRQVHIRLGEKSSRVERVLVHLANSALEERMQNLKAEHPRLRGVSIQKSAWLDMLKRGVKEADPEIKPYYLLVDQEGFAMMYYSSAVDGGDLLKDLKRALKHSIDYQ